MITRTIRLFGQGVGGSTEIAVTANGTLVYQGPVNVDPNIDPGDQFTGSGELIASFEIAGEFVGTVPVSIAVQTGCLVTTDTYYNYTLIVDPADPETFISGPDLFGPIVSEQQTDPKINVTIDSIPRVPGRQADEIGEWYWEVPAESVLAFDINIPSAAVIPNE
jgi:hypothetical protein